MSQTDKNILDDLDPKKWIVFAKHSSGLEHAISISGHTKVDRYSDGTITAWSWKTTWYGINCLSVREIEEADKFYRDLHVGKGLL